MMKKLAKRFSLLERPVVSAATWPKLWPLMAIRSTAGFVTSLAEIALPL
jgi:hypothetical protein